jgi:hypothetical protein
MENKARNPIARISVADALNGYYLEPGVVAEGMTTLPEVDQFFTEFIRQRYGNIVLKNDPLSRISGHLFDLVQFSHLGVASVPARAVREDLPESNVRLTSFEAEILNPQSIACNEHVMVPDTIETIMLRAEAAVLKDENSDEVRVRGFGRRVTLYYPRGGRGFRMLIEPNRNLGLVLKRINKALGIEEDSSAQVVDPLKVSIDKARLREAEALTHPYHGGSPGSSLRARGRRR